MSAVPTIETIVGTRLLVPELTIIPPRGATDDEIQEEEEKLGRSFCPDHAAVLRRWNGIALEVIRLFGCGEAHREIGRMSELQITRDFGVDGAIAVGSDASGFVYLQSRDGRVFEFDTDGGKLEKLADSLDDFIDRLVFGADAATFGGDDWLQELREVGLVR
jgi:hypothetical protein